MWWRNDKSHKRMQQISTKKHDWVEVVIHWELSKKFKFDHSAKWYMYKAEFIQEKETKFGPILLYKKIV